MSGVPSLKCTQIAAASQFPRADRLESWKEIASFFRREVRTVQLWEKNEGLPVWRHHHRKLGTVYAFRSELESWWFAASARLKPVPLPHLKKEPVGAHQAVAQAPAQREDRIRVSLLLFRCIDEDAGSEYLSRMRSFALGLREELLIELGRPKRHCFQVLEEENAVARPRSSGRSAKPASDVVLTGTLRCSGGRIRVVARLLRTRDATCMWSERFDVCDGDTLNNQAEVAARITEALLLRTEQRGVGPGQAPKLLRVSARVEQGQRAWETGRFFWKQRDPVSLHKAIQYFDQAIAADATCMEGYAGLSDCYISLVYSQAFSPGLAVAKARQATQAIRHLKGNSAEAHNSLANEALNFSWDWGAAERECILGCEQDPSSSRGLQLYSIFMIANGRHEEAIRLALEGLRLDPFSKVINNEVAYAYYYAGDYRNALPYARRAVELDPLFTMGYMLLGMTEAALDHWAAALAAFDRAIALSGDSSYCKPLLAYTHAKYGDTRLAKDMLQTLEPYFGDPSFPHFNVAAAYMALDDAEKAIHNLRLASAQRDAHVTSLRSDARFFKLQARFEFQELVAEIFPGQKSQSLRIKYGS